MAFRPAQPTSSDYAEPFPDWVLAAIPGADDKEAAVAEAVSAFQAASVRFANASRKFNELGGHRGPTARVKRADWDRADDLVRVTAADRDAAELIYRRAARARFDFVYDAMDEPAFAAQVEPMFAEASRRAAAALDNLRLALTERDDFLNALGRKLDVDGGNWGLRNALANISAYIEAGLVDEENAAWSIVTDALEAALLMPGDRSRVLVECVAVRNDGALSVAEKAERYNAILGAHGIRRQRVLK